MTTLTNLIHSATEDASITGLVYAGTVSVTALTAIAAPTAERRRDARAALKVMLRVSNRE